jgi:hypothetical protein
MRVARLRIKRATGWTDVDEVRAIAGVGLDGDVHASASSPRQVLVVDAAVPELGANLWIDGFDQPPGTILRIGAARLWLTFACETCHRIGAIADEVRGRRGVLAQVLDGGAMSIGAAVRVDGARPPLAPRWQDRVAAIVAALPADKVVTYARLLELAGLQPAYARALAQLLRRLDETRVISARHARGRTDLWDGDEYFRR